MTYIVPNSRPVGFLDLSAPVTFRQHYETAAWYTDTLVQPGRYVIEERWSRYDGRRYFAIDFAGVIVAHDTGALWGGMPIGNKPQGKDSDRVGSANVHTWTASELSGMAQEVATTGVFMVGNYHGYAPAAVTIFGMAARVVRRDWYVWNDSHFQPRHVDGVDRMPDCSRNLVGYHTCGRRGYWSTRYDFRPTLALPASVSGS